MVHQPGCTGIRIWSRRGRQVAGREALIRAMCAGSEGDGARVRDAATHVKSGCEEEDRRDPRRRVEPRCLAKAGGNRTQGRNMSAIHGPPATTSIIMRKSLARRSARCEIATCRQTPLDWACQGDHQASYISWHVRGRGSGASDKRQRAPDGTPRGSRAWAGLKDQRLWANWGRGGCVPTWAKSQVEPLDPERKKKTLGAEEDVVLAQPRVPRKVDFRYLWVTERARGRG